MRLASSGGVSVALHDFGGAGAPLLFSHATGFHAHCYLPLARELAHDVHAHGLDYRGHGHSSQPAGWQGEYLDWRGCGDDAVLAAAAVAPEGGLVGFGHSMGGAALLMAAAREPGRFRRLVLFEPIVYPPPPEPVDPESIGLVVVARRRRQRFDSYQAAFDNFASKPPLAMFDHDVLHEYVEHGFAPVHDDAGSGVELRCTPEFEAATFGGSLTNGVWDLLPTIETPVLVIAGRIEADQPSRFGAAVAERLPRGEYLELPHMTHFGPFTHLAEIADLLRA